jgi:DNA-binding NtrC family response regulator
MANVLVVDDDQAILDIVELWLRSEGHTVSQALDGDVALNSLDEEDFDVMITDLIMPRTEEIQLILEIRRTHKDMGIVAISAGGKKGVSYLDAAKKLGADTIISKPLDQDKVIGAVETLLH